MIEILSPVGNAECLSAAVRSGADAVYLGTAQFNARRNADNFSSDSLKKAVAYCHIRGVKVYLTLNTLLYCGELDSALDTAIAAANAGVDGIIVADLGLAKMINDALPEMPLHASTQLSVHSKEALPLLKELGFCRVVPAREMSKNELKAFCEQAKRLEIEVETFIHGALCMCLSGQCLMSAHLGGRSGNRGLCAGTCRLPFSAGGKNSFALSLKDMSHIGYIKELSEMGVTSFKIEGRMKPPEYVAAATAAARQMADCGFVEGELLELLEKVFSRNGFTDGYYTAKKEDMFGVRTDSDLSVTRSAEGRLHELYRNERQSVPIDFKFICKMDKASTLTVFDGQNTATVEGKAPEAAVTKPLDEDFVKSQLKKLGGTPFKAGKTEVILGEGLRLSVADIKAMRREACEKLSEIRAFTEPVLAREVVNIRDNSPAQGQKLYARFNSINSIPKDLSGIDAVILPAEIAGDYKGTKPLFADLPRGLSDKDFVEKCFKTVKENNLTVICHNIATLQTAKRLGLKFIAGAGLNTLNTESFGTLENLGAELITLSFEAKLSEFKSFNPSKSALNVYGKTPLMLTACCPIKADVGCKGCKHKITDRKGVDFPLYCRGGYSEIYNSRPLWLADRLEEFSGFSALILNFLDETDEEIQKIISAYTKKSDYKPLEYTRGLYYKGVL